MEMYHDKIPEISITSMEQEMLVYDYDSLYAIIDDESFGIIKKILRTKKVDITNINNSSALIIETSE